MDSQDSPTNKVVDMAERERLREQQRRAREAVSLTALVTIVFNHLLCLSLVLSLSLALLHFLSCTLSVYLSR